KQIWNSAAVVESVLSMIYGHTSGMLPGTEIALPVGARLARESVGAVCQMARVIVLRGQASLQQGERGFHVGAELARDETTTILSPK
ncbi:hypothetical protein QCD79_30995, partial [Pseudomonas quasicaspiana]|nr:hypothetical protein [Pseudomonas quasicaspiana]